MPCVLKDVQVPDDSKRRRTNGALGMDKEHFCQRTCKASCRYRCDQWTVFGGEHRWTVSPVVLLLSLSIYNFSLT